MNIHTKNYELLDVSELRMKNNKVYNDVKNENYL